MAYQPPSRTRFYRDKRNGKIMGICAGIADYTGFDVTLVRIGMIAAVFLSSGSILPVYFIAGWLRPTSRANWKRRMWRSGISGRSVRQSPARTARDIRLRLKDIDRRLGGRRKLRHDREPLARPRDRAVPLTLPIEEGKMDFAALIPICRHPGRRGHHVDLLQISGAEGRRPQSGRGGRRASMPRRSSSKRASPSSNGSSPIAASRRPSRSTR